MLDKDPTAEVNDDVRKRKQNGRNGGICHRLHDAKYRVRLLHTACVMWMFIFMGWNTAVVGSTFPDLRLIMDKDLETASWIFTASSIGYLLGSFVFGILFDKLDRMFLLATVTSLLAVSSGLLPWCENFPLMCGVNFLSGVFMGGTDVGGNSHIANIWGRHAAPFMQWIHFGFSFGGIISPFTADPFLAEKRCLNTTTGSETVSQAPGDIESDADDCEEVFGPTHIQYTYLISAVVGLSTAIPFIALKLCSKRHKTVIDTPLEDEEDSNDKQTSQRNHLPSLSLKLKVAFVTLLMLVISVYASGEGRFSSLLSTFVTEHMHWSTRAGLRISSIFWGTFAAGRFVGIGVTRFLRPATMILVYMIALTLSFVGFLFGALYEMDSLIWAFSALAGFSMSVIFPSVFTWTAESVLTVTGKISAVYLVGVSTFNMLLPLLYGYLMDNYTQLYFVYLLLAGCVINLCIYLAIRLLLRLYVSPTTAEPSSQQY